MSQNDSITSNILPEKIEKFLNEIYIGSVVNNEDSIEFDFSENTLDTLKSIAWQCPYIYGNGVYKARLLLSFVDTTYYYNGCELTEFPNNEKIAHQSPVEEKTISEFAVYPNPANNMITVINPTGKASVIDIFDYTGNKILSTRIDNSVNILSIGEMPSGFYIYRITSNNEVNKTDKLLIIK